MNRMTPTPWQLSTIPMELMNTDSAASIWSPPFFSGGASLIADVRRSPGDEPALANANAIVSAINGTYGQGIDPSGVKEMYEALVAIVELHDLGGLAEMVELGTKDVFSHAKIVLQMCRISIEIAKL